MSNRYFSFVNTFIAGSVAKSSEVNAVVQDIQAGFDAVQLELNTAIKVPASESATNIRIAEAAGARLGYVVGFNGSGAAGAYNRWYIDWNANSNKLTNLANPTASGDAVNLGYLTTYSASLAGVASPGGSIGALISADGTSITWKNQGANSGYLLPTFPNGTVSAANDYSGNFLVMNDALPAWTGQGINLIFDPNGYRGTSFWTTSLNSTYNQKGYYWKNAGALVAATFDHTPNSDGFILCSPGIQLRYSFRILTTGSTAGTIDALIEFYDGAYALLSTSALVPITMNNAISYYKVASGTTPAGTAFVKPVLRFTGVSAPAGAIEYRNPKLERGSVVTPFTDDFTLGWMVAFRETYYDGQGYANPRYVLGDGTAVSASQDFRSTTGSQAYDVRLQSTSGTNGTPGKGTLTITANQVKSSGPIGYTAEYDAGNVGAGITIDFLNGARQKCTLNAATPTITFSAAPQVGHYQLKVIQDPAVVRVVSYAGIAAGNCVGNAVPVITTTLSGVTFLYLYWDGSAYWVSSSNWD